MYEEYFEEEEAEHNIQKMDIKTIKLFKGKVNQTKTKASAEPSTNCPGTLTGLRRLQQVIA